MVRQTDQDWNTQTVIDIDKKWSTRSDTLTKTGTHSQTHIPRLEHTVRPIYQDWNTQTHRPRLEHTDSQSQIQTMEHTVRPIDQDWIS